ncbi:MAG: HEAT repeat domain-containing protein [Deltaproteobacteria bacterium]|nr:HEAT repeat domain-containing protein [Deltaproteobacteria bacterium]
MRGLNTARLYASGHELYKKNIQTLHVKFQEALGDRDFLFIGCANESVFLEGTFHPAKDTHVKSFLKLFHSLGISHVLLDTNTTTDELESFIGLLAGARQGQGDEVLSAMPRENIRHVQIGLLDYSVFSAIQSIAVQVAQNTQDEILWRQLILQPVATAALHLTPERIKQLTRLTDDVEELKKLLVQLDSQMTEKHHRISPAQRGLVLGNFIQNLGRTLAGIDAGRRSAFAHHVSLILSGLEPRMKIQILGSVPPDSLEEKEAGVLHEIIEEIPDSQLVYLLVDALREEGAGSPCFNNLFKGAVAKYKEPGMLLTLIRQEMHRATQERKPGVLSHWQQLEQFLMREQEIKSLNEQYHMEIQALATSIQMQKPMVEEEEKNRLLNTLQPETLAREKAKLIIDVIRYPGTARTGDVLSALLEGLSGALTRLFGERDLQTLGMLLRELYLALSGIGQETLVRNSIGALFNTEEIGELLKSLLSRCRTYEPKETMTIDAVCHLYPEKAGNYLMDLFMDLKSQDSPQERWISSTLGTLGPSLARILTRRLHDAREEHLPKLLDLVALCGERHLGVAVEDLVDHPKHELRLKAIGTLGELKAERAIPRLKEILLQKSWLKGKKLKDLQTSAARALAGIGTEEARAVLQEVAREGPSELRALCGELL